MSKRIEILVNAQCEGNVTLARVRGVANAKTFKITNNKQLMELGKGDGAVITFEGAVEKGNYIVPINCKVVESHVSGKKLDFDAYMDGLASSEPTF